MKSYHIYVVIIYIVLHSGCNSYISSEKLIGLTPDEVRNEIGEPDSILIIKHCALPESATEEDHDKYYETTVVQEWCYDSYIPGSGKVVLFNFNKKVIGIRVE